MRKRLLFLLTCLLLIGQANFAIAQNDYDDPLWTYLTGGEGEEKTWVLALDADGNSDYFIGPLFFAGLDMGWQWQCFGGDCWNWNPDYPGNSWLMPTGDYGTMTFSLFNGTPEVKVEHLMIEARGVEEGAFDLDIDTDDKKMTMTGAAPLHDEGRDPVVTQWGSIRIFDLTENFMQLGVIRDNDPNEGDCYLVYNFVIEGWVNVEGITVSSEGDATEITENNGTLQMHANVEPANSTIPAVAWSVSDADIATIDENGLLTASLIDGKVNVVATATDGSGVSASMEITVSNQDITYVTSITVKGEGDATEITVEGGSLQMIAEVEPADATLADVAWSINDEIIAEISEGGVLKAVQNGVVTVTATAIDGSGITGSTDITLTGQPTLLEMLTGGVGEEKTWVLDLKLSEGPKYFEGPMTFGSSCLGWNFECESDDCDGCWSWAADHQGWIAAYVPHGSMTFSLNGGDDNGDVKVEYLWKPVNETDNEGEPSWTPDIEDVETGTFVLDDDKKRLTFNDVAPLFTSRAGPVEIGRYPGEVKIISMTSSTLQLGILSIVSDEIFIFNYYAISEFVTDIAVTSEGDVDEITQPADTLQMYAAFTPEDASLKEVVWSVDDESLASITSDGRLIAYADGDVTVIAASTDGTDVTGSKVVSISGQPVWVTSIIVTGEGDVDEITEEEGTLQMHAQIEPANAEAQDVIWSLSDQNIATIDQDGLLTAVQNGEITVIATANDLQAVQGTKIITISGQTEILVESITVSGADGVDEITEDGGTLQMIAVVEPEDAWNIEVEWSVSDNTIAHIDSDGLLSAMLNGVVTVTAKAKDGSDVEGSTDITISNQIDIDYDHELWVALTGGVGEKRSWVLDLQIADGPKYFLGPMTFAHKNVGWTPFPRDINPNYDIDGGEENYFIYNWDVEDDANWVYEPGHVDWVAAYEPHGSMTFWIDGKTARVRVEYLWKHYDDDGEQTADPKLEHIEEGAVLLNLEDKILTMRDVAPLFTNRANPPGIGRYPGKDGMKLIGLSDDYMQFAVTDLEKPNEVFLFNYYAIKNPVTEITVSSEGGATEITEDRGTLAMSAVVEPADADLELIRWSVSDESLAVIDEDGLLSARDNGTVTVKANAVDGSLVYGSMDIEISEQTFVFVTGITVTGEGGVDEITVRQGTLQMIADIEPEDATEPDIEWSVSNVNIATISEDGLLTATGAVNATVTVTAAATDGSGVSGQKEVTISGQLGTSITEVAKGIFLYPNPVSSNLFIRTDSNIDRIEIYALDGQKIISFDNVSDSIDLSALRQGVYILRAINDDNSYSVKRIIKE